MAQIFPERMTAKFEGDFVVFLIGMRVNKPWKIHKWIPASIGMYRMIKELERLPSDETGFLGHNGLTTALTVQYWRSFDHLEAYARSPDRAHFPAWVAFNQRIKGHREDLGIWHETYLVKSGQYETLYSGMPAYGLGRFGDLVPAKGALSSAKSRLQQEKVE